MRRPGIVVAALALSLVAPASIQAQRLPPVPSYASHAVLVDTTQRAVEKTYWLEGGVVGGMVLGLVTLPLAGMSEGSRPTVAESAVAFMIGATVGFTVGALIGGQIRKHD